MSDVQQGTGREVGSAAAERMAWTAAKGPTYVRQTAPSRYKRAQRKFDTPNRGKLLAMSGTQVLGPNLFRRPYVEPKWCAICPDCGADVTTTQRKRSDRRNQYGKHVFAYHAVIGDRGRSLLMDTMSRYEQVVVDG